MKKNISNRSNPQIPESYIESTVGELRVVGQTRINEGNFSFFSKPVKNIIPSKNVNLEAVYELLISDIYADNTNKLRAIIDDQNRRVFKAENFDYVTFTGIFTQRSDDQLKTASNLFAIDIDHIGINLLNLKERLINDKTLSPQLIFTSPSGNGLKVVVRIDFSIADVHSSSKKMGKIWLAINQYIGLTYKDLITPNSKDEYIDGGCKDISRACFLGHDPKAYLHIDTDHSLGEKFISDMLQTVPVPLKKSKKSSTLSGFLKVNPATTLDTLAKRHLLQLDNHHPHLLAFISAAKAIATPKEQTINYIKDKVIISKQSSYKDFQKVISLVHDIYTRYNTDSEETQYLTPLSFGYKILFFRYVKSIKRFILTSLFWDEVRSLLHKAGFAKRKIGKSFLFIQFNGCVIREVNPETMRDYVTQYIEAIQQSFTFTYQGEYYDIPPAVIRETYLKNSNNIFNSSWLEHLQIHDQPILKDTQHKMYFFFKNALVTVSKENKIQSESWTNKTGFCIWEEQIIQRNFEYVEDNSSAHFYKFLNNVTNNNSLRRLTMDTGIGYLLHHHFSESEGQAVVFYDESVTDISAPMGGSGKGLIVSAIKQVRQVSKVDGKHLDSSNRFKWEQITPSTQVAWLDDVKAEFDFSLLHSNLTDGWTIERKHFSQFLIEPINSPKTVICSNSIIKGGGTTNKRRQHIIELSDFYSRQIIKGHEKPIEQTHGCLFFNNEWSSAEWNKFFSVMFDCAYRYLDQGLMQYGGINVEYNRFRQATDEDFVEWVIDQQFKPSQRYETKVYYTQFVGIYYGESHHFGQRKFTGTYLKAFARYMGWTFDTKQSGGISFFFFKTSI